jgi:hypothetical protein
MKQYYFIAVDVKLLNGGTLRDDTRSRNIERLGIMRRVLKRVRRAVPNAYGVRVTQYR